MGQELRRLTKAAVRGVAEELARRAQSERISAPGASDEARGYALGRASGLAYAALILSSSFDLGAAAMLENDVLSRCKDCGYVFCRCASCGKPTCKDKKVP